MGAGPRPTVAALCGLFLTSVVGTIKVSNSPPFGTRFEIVAQPPPYFSQGSFAMTKFAAFIFCAAASAYFAPSASAAAPKSPLDHQVTSIDGKPVDLSQYKGKVVLVVNVASRCGNTKQYANLENLYRKYKDQDLVILGFPANEFGRQEPGTNAEIAEFCSTKFGVDFPMFSKIVVKGEGIAPLYETLTSETTNPNFAGPVTWNFEKFLIGRDGQVVNRFKPKLSPEAPEVVSAIESELKKKS